MSTTDKKQKFRPNIKLDHLTKSSGFMTGEDIPSEQHHESDQTSDTSGMRTGGAQLQIDIDANPFEDDNFKMFLFNQSFFSFFNSIFELEHNLVVLNIKRF